MLAIKPEVPIPPINSYCDYGFVPELVPSGDFAILDDSDEFFMLELQPLAQERQSLRCGAATPSEIAAELSRWATREHRRFAEVDIAFRSGDPPPGLAAVRAQMADFVATVQQRMRTPVSHVHHFYWVFGVQAWASLKYPDERGPPAFPPELAVRTQVVDAAPPRMAVHGRVRTSPALPPKLAARTRAADGAPSWTAFLGRVRTSLRLSYAGLLGHVRRLAGVVPNVSIWHHLWLDSRLILNWVRTEGRPHQRNLLICDQDSPLATSLHKLASFDVRVGVNDFVANAEGRWRESDAEAERGYDNLLVHVHRANVRQSRTIMESAERYVKPGGTIALYIEHVNGETDGSNFSWNWRSTSTRCCPPTGSDIA